MPSLGQAVCGEDTAGGGGAEAPEHQSFRDVQASRRQGVRSASGSRGRRLTGLFGADYFNLKLFGRGLSRPDEGDVSMRIVCIGGGPAGLYFGLLMKKLHPEHAITIVERNKPYDTFGWGVVFSDATMAAMRVWDPETAAEIEDAFNHWDDIEVWFKGTRQRTTGHGFVRHRPQDAAQHSPAPVRGSRGGACVRARRGERPGFPGRRSHHRLRRLQLPHPQPLCRGVPARPRGAAEPLYLARHQEALRCLHLRLPQDGSTAGSRRTSTSSTPTPPPSSSRPPRRPMRPTASASSIRKAPSPSARSCSRRSWTARS